MKSWIRWWGLGAFICIILLWWLCIDSIIKIAIETLGTEANGAKVELDSAQFTLMPTTLKLERLQVTDPSQPMANLVEVEQMTLDLDSLRLLRRQAIVDQLSASGLQFNTERTHSGAIKGRILSQEGILNSDTFNLSDTIPGLSLPDTDTLIAEEKQHLQNEVDGISQQLKALEDQWQKRIDDLPDDEDFAAYKQRWKETKKKGWMEKLQGIRELQKDIERDLNNISGLDDQLSKDLVIVQQQLDKAKQLPAKEADRLLAKAGLDNGTQAISEAIMSGQIKQWAQQAMGVVSKLSGGTADNSTPAQPPRGKGQWVHFVEEQPMPDVLVRKADLSGQLAIGDQAIQFKGSAQDLTHQPKRWHNPAQFKLTGNAQQGGDFSATGLIDHRQEANDEIQFSINKLALQKLTLSDSDNLMLTLGKGLADISGNLTLKGKNIDLQTEGDFKQVSLNASTDSPSTTNEIIISALSSIQDFALSLGITGTAQQPKLTFNSDMDQFLEKALNKEIKKQTAGLKDKLQNQLSEQIAPQLKQLNGQADYLQSLESILGEKQKDIEAFSKGVL